MTDDKSDFQLALEKRARPTWTIQAEQFLSGSPIQGAIRMRVLHVTEQNAAVVEATKTAREAAKDLGLENDPDFMTNYKTACALQRACLQPDKDAPVFRSGAELLRHVTSGELVALLGHYTNAVRLYESKEKELDADKAETLAIFLAQADPNQSIEHLLNTLDPAHLALLAVLLSVKVDGLLQESQVLRTHLKEKGIDAPHG